MSDLSGMSEEDRKDHIGEKIYPLIEKWHGENAPRITGMIIDMNPRDLYPALQSEATLKKLADEGYELLAEQPEE